MAMRTWTFTRKLLRFRSGEFGASICKCDDSNLSVISYNNPTLLSLAKSDIFATMAMNRPALGVFPPGEWKGMVGEYSALGIVSLLTFVRIAEDAFLSVAPKGLNQVFTAM